MPENPPDELDLKLSDLLYIQNIYNYIQRNDITTVHSPFENTLKYKKLSERLDYNGNSHDYSDLNTSSALDVHNLKVSFNKPSSIVSFASATSPDPEDRRLSQTENAQCSFSHAEFSSIISLAERSPRWIRTQFYLEFALSIVRNIACYALVACIAALAIECGCFKDAWQIFVLAIAALSSLGVLLQIRHIILTFRSQQLTLLGETLKQAKSYEEFEKLIVQRHSSPPFIGAEMIKVEGRFKNLLKKKTNAASTARRTDIVIKYGDWADKSTDIRQFLNQFKPPFRVIVCKDYRFADNATKETVEAEVNEFRNQFNGTRSKFTYILDASEGERFQNSLMLILPEKQYASNPLAFFRPITYKIFCCIALDSIYSLVYLALTRNAGVYNIVKYVKR